MCDHTLAIYCFIDDFLEARGHREDCRAEVTDAEVITIALTAMLYFGGNFERSRLVLHELGLVPKLLSRSRFSRRLSRLTDLIHFLIHQLGQVLKDLHWETRYVLDSFPVPVCDNIRIKRCRLVRDERYRGKIASKRRYFYGVKVQLLATSDGLPVEFASLARRVCRSARFGRTGTLVARRRTAFCRFRLQLLRVERLFGGS